VSPGFRPLRASSEIITIEQTDKCVSTRVGCVQLQRKEHGMTRVRARFSYALGYLERMRRWHHLGVGLIVLSSACSGRVSDDPAGRHARAGAGGVSPAAGRGGDAGATPGAISRAGSGGMPDAALSQTIVTNASKGVARRASRRSMKRPRSTAQSVLQRELRAHSAARQVVVWRGALHRSARDRFDICRPFDGLAGRLV
jgi:hypothetical protein